VPNRRSQHECGTSPTNVPGSSLAPRTFALASKHRPPRTQTDEELGVAAAHTVALYAWARPRLEPQPAASLATGGCMPTATHRRALLGPVELQILLCLLRLQPAGVGGRAGHWFRGGCQGFVAALRQIP
jgi:hypothetical protein